VQQGGEEGPIGGSELDLLAVYLPFRNHDLMSQGRDFGVFGMVAHGQRPQHRQRVGYIEVGQSKWHGTASSSSHRQRSHAL
jgi:hypothetical protein